MKLHSVEYRNGKREMDAARYFWQTGLITLVFLSGLSLLGR